MTAVSDAFGGTLSGWTAVNGTFSIVSGKLRGTTVGGSPASYNRFNTSTGSVDCFCQAVVSSTQTSGLSNTGMACRMRAAANTSYQVTGRHAADTLMVWRITAGSESQLTWQTGASSLSTVWGSGDTLREEVVGSLIRAKVNGALVGFCVDTNIADGMLVGVNTYNDAGGDFSEYDNWAGGALAADGGLAAPYLVGISAQVTGTGGSLGLTVPAVVAAGDTVLVHSVSRDAAQTPTAPGSQGWSASIQTPSQTGLRSTLHSKVWGLGGQTDSTSPSYTISSGTAGWGAVVTVWRNPAHATNPWTTATAAIAASGSSTDATTSSATRSCPSVNHDGTHRTLARFCDSGDDNALGTNSEGALAYGGANYDSTTGNDFAQALSVREDVTVTTSTGTATFAETLVGNDISNGITVVLGIPPTAIDLVVDDATHGQSTDGVAVTQVHALAVGDAVHGQPVDAVAVTQVHGLAVADAAHGHTADPVAVTIATDLAVADSTHAHGTDPVAVTQTHALAVGDAVHGQTATTPTLTQAHALAVADAAHTHTADAPALTQAHSLSVADAVHGHTANAVAVTQTHVLAVGDSTHAQTVDTPTVGQVHGLVVADASHQQTADQPSLTQTHQLSVSDAVHGHVADPVGLALEAIALAVHDASHGQAADTVAVSQAQDLVVAGTTHGHTAGQVTVDIEVVQFDGPAILVAIPEPRRLAAADPPARLVALPDDYPLAALDPDT